MPPRDATRRARTAVRRAPQDAVHTAILTLKEGFEGQISGNNIEIGIIGADRKFRRACAAPSLEPDARGSAAMQV